MIYDITFKGVPYLLVSGSNGPAEGAIATPEQYASFDESFAHLMADGRVLRHNRIIGSRDDVFVIAPRKGNV